ncbi:glycosyltransferase family 2 protein [Sphingobacterium spiritivorum]|uniref:glycosyltransferase family 2 protein n=1 Tax=Sphingobacterium spiritivorum TaxID=258 RepID=UPI003DA36DB4
MSISVIVPVYNVSTYIRKCVISLFEQTLANIEFIFVDDCSPDNSINIVNELIVDYHISDTQVKIIRHSKNRGLAAARFTGLEHASGEYIIHCDSDDWVDKDLYEKMLNNAIENNADIVCCDFAIEYRNDTNYLRYGKTYETKQDLLDLQFDLLHSSACNKLVRKSLYIQNNIQSFEGINMWEDLGLLSRLRYFSSKTTMISDSYYHYNKTNETSIVASAKEDNIFQQIECAKLLEYFFADKPRDFQLVVFYMKFMSKSDYLFHPKLRDLTKWALVYPESHRYIFKYSPLPMNLKIIAFLASHGMFKLAIGILNIKSYISKSKNI